MNGRRWPPGLLPDDQVQVPRLDLFCEAHPEWRAGYDHDHHYWQAIRGEPNGETVVTRYQLRDLLGRLGEMCGGKPDPDSG